MSLMRRVFISALLIICTALLSCENNTPFKDKPVLNEYLAELPEQAPASALQQPRAMVVESGELPVRGIYRSMQGPFEVKTFELDESLPWSHRLFGGNQLAWLTGYSVEVFDPKTGQKVSDDFLCHNNLNLIHPDQLPWKIHTQGSNLRLFTLTEGQTRMSLPPGTGIPILTNQELEIAFQVLNHNYPDLDTSFKQRVRIEYYLDQDLPRRPIPVYQQSAFVTKQTNGPAGLHGEPVIIRNNSGQKPGVNDLSCGIEKQNDGTFNPFLDAYGRSFIGHWKVPPGGQWLRTSANEMLGLNENKTVHFISVHVHPYCMWMRLRDKTSEEIVFQSNIRNFQDRTGIQNIETYSAGPGITLYSEHRYEVECFYYNPTQEVHTAMATMFFYLSEPGFQLAQGK